MKKIPAKDNKKKLELIKEIVTYFDIKIFKNHIDASLSVHSSLSSYTINPIIVKYLSKVLKNNYSPEGVAQALYYPRVLGTSINTSFGYHIQKMLVELKMAKGSDTKGMDIQFRDKLDNRKKYCQLKAGPNTINAEDVQPLINKIKGSIALGRTNHTMKGISNNDFIVGVIYGEQQDLSMHYKLIDKSHPVIVGKDFWHRVSGYPDFYEGLVKSLQSCIDRLDTKDLINKGYRDLVKEIKLSKQFKFKKK